MLRAAIAVAIMLGLPGAAVLSAQIFGTPTPSLGYELTPYYAFPPGAGGAPELNDSPTSICFDAQHRAYVLSLDGKIRVLLDQDQDGVAETVTMFFDGSQTFPFPADGIACDGQSFYVAALGEVWKLVDADQDLLPEVVAPIITGLPYGMHQNNGFAFDGQGKIYFGVGSQTDHGLPTHPYAATIMRADLDGQNLEVYATGMRNAFGLAWSPALGLVCTENAWNFVYTDPSFDEINQVVQGHHYGFPVQTGPATAASGITSPIAVLPPHSAPCGIAFDPTGHWTGFPDDMYVAFVAAGAGAVARVSVYQNPQTGAWHQFVYPIAYGFTAAIDVKFDANGDLYCLDFQTQVVWKLHASETARIRVHSPPQLGHVIQVTCEAPDHPNEYLLIGLSTAFSPAIGLPDGRVFPLDVDSFVFSYTTTPGNIVNLFATPDFTDGSGHCNGQFYLPFVPALDGFALYTAFVTVTPSLTFGAVSPPLGFSVFY